MISKRRLLPSAHSLLLPAALLLLASCSSAPRVASTQAAVSGDIHGGQQPVAGVTIQLYAVGSGGDGTAAMPLFATPPTSTAAGNFTFPAFTCPSTSALVYVVGTGGDPTPGMPNPQLALMAALGPCGNLNASTYISVNELTTVAAVYALAPFMTSPSSIASGSSDTTALSAAFTLAAEFANSSTGATPGTGVPAGMAVPTAQIRTIADILATCINSPGGYYGDSPASPCGTFFDLTTPAGVTPPADAITALLNLANHPTLNTASLYPLASPTAPYQPTVASTPPNFSVALSPITPLVTSPTGGLTFGSTLVGATSASQNFTVTNPNVTDISITSVGFTGDDSNDFTLTIGCPFDIPANTSCTMSVAFAPTASGTRTASVALGNTASATAATMPLSGEGLTPGTGPLKLSTTSITMTDFASGTVNLTNTGNSPLLLTSISTSYGFSQVNGCGSTLGPQALCTVVVTPPASTNPALLTGTLTIASSASNSPQTVSLTSSLDTVENLGTANIGSTSPSPFTYLGSNPDIEQRYYVSGSISGPDAGDFYFVGGISSCTSHLGPCSIAVGMMPRAAGSRVAVLSIDDYEMMHTYVLSGTGVDPAAPAVSFVGSLPSTVNFTTALESGQLKNTGPTVLQFNANPPQSFVGANASEFTLNQGCSGTLAVNATCNFSFYFSPQVTGTRSAIILLPDATSGTTLQIPISIYSTLPQVTFSQTTFAFPPTHLGVIATQTFTINPAGQSLVISKVAAPFSISPTACSGTTACTITVTYAPTVATSPGTSGNSASDKANPYVYNSTAGTYTYLALSGTPGVSSPSLSAAQLNFGTETVGGSTATQTATIYNFGDGYMSLNLGTTGVVGPNPSTATSPDFPYSYNGVTYIPIAPGGSYSFPLYFKPAATGVRDSTLRIYSDAVGSPSTVILQGTGN